MVFKKFVEIGRVVYVANGKQEGKLGAIVNVVDGNRVRFSCALEDSHLITPLQLLIDGPGITRQMINMKDIHLTRFTVKDVLLNQRGKVLNKKWTESDIDGQWTKSTWAQKIAARNKVRTWLHPDEKVNGRELLQRASMNDFDRFKLMKAKQQRNRIIRGVVNGMIKKKKAAKK